MVEAAGMAVSFALLGVAACFGVAAALRTTGAERACRPPGAGGLWATAATSGAFGFVLLVVVVATLLISLAGGDRMLVTPRTAGGMERHDNPALQGSLEKQKQYVREAGLPNPTVAFYRTPGATTSSVAFAGGWGVIPDPGRNLRNVLRAMGETFRADPRPQPFPAGSLEGEVLCLDGGSIDGDTLAICGWADRSTVGVVMARKKSVDEGADLLRRMRPDLERTRS